MVRETFPSPIGKFSILTKYEGRAATAGAITGAFVGSLLIMDAGNPQHNFDADSKIYNIQSDITSLRFAQGEIREAKPQTSVPTLNFIKQDIDRKQKLVKIIEHSKFPTPSVETKLLQVGIPALTGAVLFPALIAAARLRRHKGRHKQYAHKVNYLVTDLKEKMDAWGQ
jgi:hypothetical protein